MIGAHSLGGLGGGEAVAPGADEVADLALVRKMLDTISLESRSLGGAEYRSLLSEVGLRVTAEHDDEGQNHYIDAVKLANDRK